MIDIFDKFRVKSFITFCFPLGSYIKFCLWNEMPGAKTSRVIKIDFGDHALPQRNIFKWHKQFKEGRESVEDEEPFGRSSTFTDEQHVKKIKELVNRRLLETLLLLLVFPKVVNTILDMKHK